MTRTIVIVQEENWYVATDIISSITSQGKTIDEATSLKEALELYYEDNEKKLSESDCKKVYITTLELN